MATVKKVARKKVTREKNLTHVERQTKNYRQFNIADWNRDTERFRINLVKTSIVKCGKQLCPIMVNEHMTVIDGQARLRACEELGIPVKYIVIPGLTMKDCIIMNSINSRWKIMSYVKSYKDYACTEEAKKQYTDLYDILTNKQYKKAMPPVLLIKVCMGEAGFNQGTEAMKKVKNGKFKFARPVPETKEMLNYLADFESIIARIGRKEMVIPVLVNAYKSNKINNKQFLQRCNEHYEEIHGVGGIDEAIGMFEKIYNHNRKSERTRVNFREEFKALKDNASVH